MKKPLEILAPGGSLDAIAAAVAHGANAVYAGVGTLNARATAQNLAVDQLPALAGWLQARSVKLYIALNVPVAEAKRAEAVRVLAACHQAGVDAVILRDEMLMRLAREQCPGLAIHASTQCAALTPDAAYRLQQLGCTRVILPREFSRRDIAAVRRACPKLELEAFVFGAMCFAVSGCCLLGEAVAGRSGNYGNCAQACRLPFNTPEGEARGHLLSMKDLDLTGQLNALAEAGVDAVKIEGRLKPAAYVGCVTQALSNAMLRGGTLAKVQAEEFQRDISVIWSRTRGEGFFHGTTAAADLTDPTAAGHRGLTVPSFTCGQRNNEQMLVFTAPVPLAVRDGLLLSVRDSDNRLSERPFVLKRLYNARTHPVSIVKAGQVLQTPVPRGWRVVGVAIHSAHLVANRYTGGTGPDPAKLTELPLRYETVKLATDTLQLTGLCGRFRHTVAFPFPTEATRGESCSPAHLTPLFGSARYQIEPGLYANPKHLRECRREFVAQFRAAYEAERDERAVALLRCALQQEWPAPVADRDLLAQQAAVSWVTGLPAGDVRTSAGDTFTLEEKQGRTHLTWRGRVTGR